MGEIQRKYQSKDRCNRQQDSSPDEREDNQRQVARDPDRRYRNVRNLCKRAVVDDAAIPLLVDRAGLSSGVVVNAQCQRGNHHACQGKQCNQISHPSESDATRAPPARYDEQMDQLPPSARRIAFFGGSFDPPHLGHLAVARAASAALALDAVLFAPVGAQPLKPHGSTASFDDRLAMTRLAIAGEQDFEVSLADAPKPSGTPNFTLETLQTLRAELPPNGALFCLMGADSFFGMRLWHRSAEIPFVAPLIVASRPGQRPEQWIAGLRAALPPGLSIESVPDVDGTNSDVEVRSYLVHNPSGDTAPFCLLPGLHVEISASQIRDQIREQIPAAVAVPVGGHQFLPKAVMDYIRSRGLYR